MTGYTFLFQRQSVPIYLLYAIDGTWHSVATRLWAGCSGVGIPTGARDICLLQNVNTSPATHPASYSVCTKVGKAARFWC